MLDRLKAWVDRGGPEPGEYAEVAECFARLRAAGVGPPEVAAVFAPTLTTNCIHGHAYLKPHGYPGDFELIDRFYTSWESPDPFLVRWDRFVHSQPAPRAVRNRKELFKGSLGRLGGPSPVVLNVGSGPARDVFEFYRDNLGAAVRVECVDLDPRAIEYGAKLCRGYADRVSFARGNLLRLRPPRGRYDLVWAGGVFDYFPDRVFAAVLARLLAAVSPGGRLVVGNFAAGNPSRSYMELVSEWYLHHRTADDLRRLAAGAGAPPGAVDVVGEPEGVNLFLTIRGAEVPPAAATPLRHSQSAICAAACRAEE